MEAAAEEEEEADVEEAAGVHRAAVVEAVVGVAVAVGVEVEAVDHQVHERLFQSAPGRTLAESPLQRHMDRAAGR